MKLLKVHHFLLIVALVGIFYFFKSVMATTEINYGVNNSVNTGKIIIDGVEEGHCVKGNGQLATDRRVVGPFTKIILDGAFQAKIVNGKKDSVIIKSDSNLSTSIMATVVDNTLSVAAIGSICSENEITVEVEIMNLRGFTSLGVNDVELDVAHDLEELSIAISGATSMSVNGSRDRVKLTVSDSAEFDGGSFMVNEAVINASGSSETTLHVKNTLSGLAKDSSEVLFSGNPGSVDTVSQDVGEFIHVE